jgi:Tfp pilus assembly protein PilO
MKAMTLPAAARLLWLLAAAILLGVGVGLIWLPSSQAIAQLETQAKELYERADQNEAEVRDAAHLRAAAQRIDDDVHSLSGQASASAAMARALTLLEGDARTYGIEIRSVAPAPHAPPAPSAGLSGTPLEIDAHGSFRALLAFAADLPRHDALIEVDDVDLAAAPTRSPAPALDAKIDATIYRYHPASDPEVTHAPGTL